MEDSAMYLPKLCDWVNEKIVFWQSELGSAWVHGKERSSTKSFSVSVNKGSSNRTNKDSEFVETGFSKTGLVKPGLQKPKCIFCEGTNHDSLFKCNDFKKSDISARCRFIVRNRLCWRCLERGHIGRYCGKKT